MEFYRFFSVWIIVSLLSGVKSNENIETLNDRMDILENEMNKTLAIFDFENIILTDKADPFSKRVKNILKMKTDLKKTIRRYITELLSDILEEESDEKLIPSQVLHQMSTSLGQDEENTKLYPDGLQRGERQSTEMFPWSQILVKSKFITYVLARDDRQIKEVNHDLGGKKDSSELSSKTINKAITSLLDVSKYLKSEALTNKLARYDRQIIELNRTLREQRLNANSSKSTNLTSNRQTDSPLNTRQTASVSPTSTAAVPRAITTSKPSTERSGILVVPYWSSDRLQMQQLNIITNSFDKYPYLSLSHYVSALYVSKINSLLIGLVEPSRIIISELNTSKTETIKHNVWTEGMAADEERGIVFLTTLGPHHTISSMSLRGENFTTLVDLPSSDSIFGDPGAIAIEPTFKIIYACNDNKLFKVFYNGTGLRAVDTGFEINGVTLDITKGLLYYNKDRKLMKMSLNSQNISEVTRLNSYIWNLIFYQNKVYFSSRNEYPSVLGVVDVELNGVSRTLQTLNVSDLTNYSICLIP